MYLPDLFWKYKRPIALIAFLGLSCLVMVDSLHRKWVDRAGRQLVHSAAYPVQKISQGANDGAANFLSLIPDFFRTRAQNAALRKRLGEMEQEIVSLREEILRARRLQDISDFGADIEGRKLTARVIGVSPTAWFSTIVVDRGSSDGIKKFMPAVSASGVAGYVMEVYLYSSRILLLTDSNSKVSVIAQRSRARGVVQGTDTGSCLLKYVEATADVAEGDVLVTSGDSKIYPEGLPVGRISELRRRSGDLFQSALVTPSTDFAKIEEVVVILEKKTPDVDIGADTEQNGAAGL